MVTLSPGCLLVATPSLDDPNFRRSVVLVMKHDDEGSFGLVLNRPLHAAPVAAHLPGFQSLVTEPGVVFVGGPVERTHAFALARFPANTVEPEQQIIPGVGVIGLEDIPAMRLIEGVRVYTGYAGWAAGQLAAEIKESAWFVVEAMPSDVFSKDPQFLWRSVLHRQNGNLAMFAFYPEEPGVN